MRCSSCEVLLDRYVEATLPPQQMAAISKHLEHCLSCSALVAELRVVDALLATTKPAGLAPNFTFAVMAEVRGASVVQPKNFSVWAGLSFYTVAAWIALVTAFLVYGPRVGILSAAATQARDSVGNAFLALSGTAHAVAPSAPYVAAFVVGVLSIDIILIGALVLYYRTLRPRLAAQLAPSEAS